MSTIKIFLGYLVLLFLWSMIFAISNFWYVPVLLYVLGHAIVYVCVRHIYRKFKFRGFINIFCGITLLFCYLVWIPKFCHSQSLTSLLLVSLSFFFLFVGIRGGYVLFGQNEYHEGLITLLF